MSCNAVRILLVYTSRQEAHMKEEAATTTDNRNQRLHNSTNNEQLKLRKTKVLLLFSNPLYWLKVKDMHQKRNLDIFFCVTFCVRFRHMVGAGVWKKKQFFSANVFFVAKEAW